MNKHVALIDVTFIDESETDSDVSSSVTLKKEVSSSSELSVIIDHTNSFERDSHDSSKDKSNNQYRYRYESNYSVPDLKLLSQTNEFSQNSFDSESNVEQDSRSEYSSTEFELIDLGNKNDHRSKSMKELFHAVYNDEQSYLSNKRDYEEEAPASPSKRFESISKLFDLNSNDDISIKYQSQGENNVSDAEHKSGSPKKRMPIYFANYDNHESNSEQGSSKEKDLANGHNHSKLEFDKPSTGAKSKAKQKKGRVAQFFEHRKQAHADSSSKYRVPDSSQSTQSLKSKKNLISQGENNVSDAEHKSESPKKRIPIYFANYESENDEKSTSEQGYSKEKDLANGHNHSKLEVDKPNTGAKSKAKQKKGRVAQFFERRKQAHADSSSKYRVPDSSQSTQSLKSKKNLSSLLCCFKSHLKDTELNRGNSRIQEKQEHSDISSQEEKNIDESIDESINGLFNLAGDMDGNDNELSFSEYNKENLRLIKTSDELIYLIMQINTK